MTSPSVRALIVAGFALVMVFITMMAGDFENAGAAPYTFLAIVWPTSPLVALIPGQSAAAFKTASLVLLAVGSLAVYVDALFYPDGPYDALILVALPFFAWGAVLLVCIGAWIWSRRKMKESP